MGFYENQVVPRLVNFACGQKDLQQYRDRVCEGLTGEVVEIGFGSGLNVPSYPSGISRVTAVEPADLGWKMAADRIAASAIPIERSGLDGQALPFEDETFDHAISTWTMCTIPDVARALAEVRRVLKPGGTFHFVEHGLAPDEKVQVWQHRLEPINKRIAGGCHLSRRIGDLVTDAGFTLKELDRFYAPGAPKVVAAFNLGVAAA